MAELEAEQPTHQNELKLQPGSVIRPDGFYVENETPTKLTAENTPENPVANIIETEMPDQHSAEQEETKSSILNEPTETNLDSQNQPPEELFDKFTWTASEYVHHEKSLSWYVGLAVAVLSFAGLSLFLTGDIITFGVITIAGLIFGFYATHKPSDLDYSVDHSGLTIGSKSYPYDEFKYFTLVHEGAYQSVLLMPLKRFATSRSIYFKPEQADKILSIISEVLPLEEHKPDAVDKLMRQIRF
ncbi:MAG: hypothetical protein NVS1B10_04520 [Candidatus Saccharimonadales bacterium]